jgi:hypothetical protein
MSDDVADVVFVPVVEITTGREIGWNTNVSELLRSRLSDIKAAISAGAESVASSLTSLPTYSTSGTRPPARTCDHGASCRFV